MRSSPTRRRSLAPSRTPAAPSSPGASVVAVNVGTKDTYEATTNDQGYYNIQFVRIGRYEITVTLASFQTFKATGIEVGTNQIVRQDAVLQVGGMAETVTVEAAASLLATENATVAETIRQEMVAELPLSGGRNVWSLAGTTPGVLGGTSSFTGAGQRNIQNSLSMDGINSAANLLTATSMRPIADAITEVQVQTGSTSAEYGSYLGVHVNVVSKSGTNQAHGNLYEFLQHDSFAARQYFEDRSTPANPRRRDQFGFQTDGPVFIPRLYDGRNRTFFMAAYEGVREEETTTSISSVPTALMRQGNFSEVSTAIRNPFTNQAFPGNVIPAGQISAQALRILEFYPLANRPGTASNLVATGQNIDETDQFLTRVDQNIGNKARLYVRYNWQDQFDQSIGAIPVAGGGGPNTNYNTLVAYTHTFTNRLVNDFRVGYHSVYDDSLNYFAMNGITDAGAALGIPGFDGDVRYDNPGIPSLHRHRFQRLWRRRHELVSVRQDHPVLERSRLHDRVAQHPDRLRCAAPRDRTPRREQPTRVVHVHRRNDRVLGGGSDARAAAHGDDPARSASGPRRRMALGVLHQRQLAGHAKPDGEPRRFATSTTRRSRRSKGSRRCSTRSRTG